MAAGKLSEPGTEFGPCENEYCGHSDCQSTRDMANGLCAECGAPIGYNVRFYDLGKRGLVHAACIEK